MKRVTLEELLYSHLDMSYEQQYSYIINLIETGRVKPIVTSGTNGKKPALYRRYWVIEENLDYQESVNERSFEIWNRENFLQKKTETEF